MMSSTQDLRRFKAEFFKALAHPIRIHILDMLREGERNVNEMKDMLNIEAANVSQQLAVLRNKNLVTARREGNNVYYTIRDPAIFELLDISRKIFDNHLITLWSILEE